MLFAEIDLCSKFALVVIFAVVLIGYSVNRAAAKAKDAANAAAKHPVTGQVMGGVARAVVEGIVRSLKK